MTLTARSAVFWTIGKKLGAGFTSILLLLVVIATIALNRFDQTGDVITDIVNVEWRKTAAATRISEIADANTIATMQQALVAPAQRAALRQRITDNRQSFLDAFHYLQSTVTTPEGQQLLARLETGRTQYVQSQNRFHELLDQGRLEDAIDELNHNTLPKLDQVQTVLAQLNQVAEQNVLAHGQQAMTAASTSMKIIALVAFIALITGLLIAMRIAKAITQPLARAVQVANAVAAGDLTQKITVVGSDETAQLLAALERMNQSLQGMVSEVRGSSAAIANATAEVATGNMDLSSRTEEQASALEETSAAMQEVVNTVQQNFSATENALQLATQASDTARQGGVVVGQAVQTMQRVSSSGQKIAEIVGLIEGIAFQTNILALNAAVEAARAGEQGRGFAVVASEVRALAGRSANASKEIRDMIQSSVGEIDRGCELVSKAGNTMGDIVKGIHDVTQLMRDVTASSREQLAGLEQIQHAVQQMDTVTQQNAALVEEGASAAQSLQAQAQLLVDTVAVFQTHQHEPLPLSQPLRSATTLHAPAPPSARLPA